MEESAEAPPEIVSCLVKKLGLSEEDIQEDFRKFHQRHPDGQMSRQDFVSHCLEVEGDSEEHAESLFNVFDLDGNGCMDFMEFMQADSGITLSSIDQKLSWMFNVYDKDGGGTIDPQEVRGIVSGLFTMVGIQGIEEDMVEENSLEMLKIIDSDGDGEITKDEFLQNAMTCDFIRDMFQIGALDDLDNEENPIQIEDKAQESQNLDSFKEDLRKSMDFSVLERKLCLIEDEIEDEYNDFMAVYTFGEMTRREFVHYCNRADGLTEDEAESLFNVFDADGSGSMDFMEFMMAKNATDLSSLEEKLKWIFNVYDKDACGTLDPEEIGEAVRGLFAMVGMEEIPEDILEIRSRELREAIDVDGDGQITKEEFIKNAMTCEFICDLMQIGALGDEDEDED